MAIFVGLNYGLPKVKSNCALKSNINDKVNMNIRNGYMDEVAEKKDSRKAWHLTSTGEQFVENNFIAPK